MIHSLVVPRKKTQPKVQEAQPKLAGATFDEPTPAPEETGDAVPREDAAAGVSKARLSIPLTEAGCLDNGSARPDTRAKLRLVVMDPELGGMIGLPKPPEPEAEAVTFSIAEVRYVFQVVGELEAWLVARGFGLPMDDARKIFHYTAQEMQDIAEPAAACLTRYAPKILREHKELFALVMALVAIHQQKLLHLGLLVAAKKHAAATKPITAQSPQGDGRATRGAGESLPPQ